MPQIFKNFADFEVAKITGTYFGYFPVAVNQTGLEAKLTNIHYFPKNMSSSLQWKFHEMSLILFFWCSYFFNSIKISFNSNLNRCQNVCRGLYLDFRLKCKNWHDFWIGTSEPCFSVITRNNVMVENGPDEFGGWP